MLTADDGLERATREAQRLIKAGVLDDDSQRLSRAVDGGLGLAASCGGLVLSPWVALVVGVGALASSTVGQLGGKAARRWKGSQHRLESLAKAPSGALDVLLSGSSTDP